VSFGSHDTEEEAARQYDRALIVEKGRGAKTNFPLVDYELEVAQYVTLLNERCGPCSSASLPSIAQTPGLQFWLA